MTTTTTTRTTPTAPVGALPGPLPLGLTRAGYELRLFFRERDAVVFVFAYPVIMLAIFAAVFGQDGATVTTQGGAEIPFAQYFLPGMVATGIMLSSFQSLAISIAVERDEGGLKRLRGTPLPATAYFAGKVGQVLGVSLLQNAVLLVVAASAFGVTLPTTATAWATFVWVFVLGTACGSVCGVAFSSVPRSGRSASAVVTPIVLVLQFISGVFFPFDQLPSWMQGLASVFPLRWLVEGMSAVFVPTGSGASGQHGTTALVLGAWLAAGLVVGVRTFRWRRRDDG
ncbi:transport permease protein [Cellulomonas chitinilytica]|uniref:Transport permease protein n=1 Tax=Cellulomonas chitinilytica TaxID=398759 RepID=A0A919U3F3_9CELL|nr:ABC transporter permease [Cellulomonas chitinilytica]GIG22387.1 transport permease protein [Cellulomonas chitinilytica]